VWLSQGFFEGCESGSPQFDERFQRAKKKFFDKYKPSASATPIPAPAPAAAPAGPSEEDKAAAQSAKGDGNTKLRAGDLDGALEAYSKAIELDPTCAIFYANRAAVYTKMTGTENLELAVADCQESVALDPSYVKAYSRLGLAYYHLGNYEESVNEGYAKAVELDPSNASAKKDLENAKKKLASAAGTNSTGGGAGSAPPTDPLAAMMAGLGGGGSGGGMPDMSSLMGMMQDPAIQQMAQQMMGGGGGGGMPDLSGLMSAMGGTGAGADGGGPTVEEETANDGAAGADDGAELYDDDGDDDNDVSLAAQAAAEEQEAPAAPAAAAEDNPMAAMEDKIESNPRLKAIMEEVKTNPMAIMQHM
jgi:small glutamine-rich tetratricopeptide repeat-containing protein alpha